MGYMEAQAARRIIAMEGRKVTSDACLAASMANDPKDPQVLAAGRSAEIKASR